MQLYHNCLTDFASFVEQENNISFILSILTNPKLLVPIINSALKCNGISITFSFVKIDEIGVLFKTNCNIFLQITHKGIIRIGRNKIVPFGRTSKVVYLVDEYFTSVESFVDYLL